MKHLAVKLAPIVRIDPHMSKMIYQEANIISDDDDEDIQIIEMPNLFENLLDVLLIEIFGHLNARDLRRAASVCKRWQKIAKESIFWTTYDTAGMGIFHSNLLDYLSKLPSYITRLRIFLTDKPVKGINLPSISLLINERCPNLEELYFQGCTLSSIKVFEGSIPAIVEQMKEEEKTNFINKGTYGRHSSTIFLPTSLRVLSFRDLPARSMSILFRLRSAKQLPNLEVLDYRVAYFEEKTTGPLLLPSCPSLKELHLVRSYVASGIEPLIRLFHNLKILNLSNSCFKVEDLKKLNQYSKNLEELYLCQMDFCDKDMCFVDSTFLSLKVICLSGSRITMQSVARLFRDCRSLRRFYANFGDGSKCGCYTITGRGFAFHETPECSVIHLCEYKHHV